MLAPRVVVTNATLAAVSTFNTPDGAGRSFTYE